MTLEVSKGCETSCPDEAGTYDFSGVSTGYSVIDSSCEMKDERDLKTLQGNLAFF